MFLLNCSCQYLWWELFCGVCGVGLLIYFGCPCSSASNAKYFQTVLSLFSSYQLQWRRLRGTCHLQTTINSLTNGIKESRDCSIKLVKFHMVKVRSGHLIGLLSLSQYTYPSIHKINLLSNSAMVGGDMPHSVSYCGTFFWLAKQATNKLASS